VEGRTEGGMTPNFLMLPFIAVPGDHHCEPLHLSIRSEAVNHSSRSRFPYSLAVEVEGHKD
jgi:hypothetical protein